MHPCPNISPVNAANRLGLLYRREATALPWTGPILDAHVHINSPDAGEAFFEVAAWFGIQQVWSMSRLEDVDELRRRFGDRIQFIAVPNFAARQEPATFTTDFLHRIEGFAAKGARLVKLWAAPRGRDIHPALRLDHPVRREALRLARALGMGVMVHVADPDTWFATHYQDAARYGVKAEHYQPLRQLLDEFHDLPWLAAHMAGSPENLDHLQDLLDAHPNLHLDCSATKWMVRELSRQPDRFRAFCQANPGRVLFGSDIVVSPADAPDFRYDLYASRYWALRTLLETRYAGPSPIVDPDLSLIDPTLPADSAPRLVGASLDPATLDMLYQHAGQRFLQRLPQPPG